MPWRVRFEHAEQVEKFIGDLAKEVARRTAKEGAVGSMVVPKVFIKQEDIIQ